MNSTLKVNMQVQLVQTVARWMGPVLLMQLARHTVLPGTARQVWTDDRTVKKHQLQFADTVKISSSEDILNVKGSHEQERA